MYFLLRNHLRWNSEVLIVLYIYVYLHVYLKLGGVLKIHKITEICIFFSLLNAIFNFSIIVCWHMRLIFWEPRHILMSRVEFLSLCYYRVTGYVP